MHWCFLFLSGFSFVSKAFVTAVVTKGCDPPPEECRWVAVAVLCLVAAVLVPSLGSDLSQRCNVLSWGGRGAERGSVRTTLPAVVLKMLSLQQCS